MIIVNGKNVVVMQVFLIKNLFTQYALIACNSIGVMWLIIYLIRQVNIFLNLQKMYHFFQVVKYVIIIWLWIFYYLYNVLLLGVKRENDVKKSKLLCIA